MGRPRRYFERWIYRQRATQVRALSYPALKDLAGPDGGALTGSYGPPVSRWVIPVTPQSLNGNNTHSCRFDLPPSPFL